MKKIMTTALAAAALAIPGAALADDHKDKMSETKAKTPEIVERNDNGKATKVRIDGKVYAVCMTQEQDSCINPRAAGLKWGDIPLSYWPGRTASSMERSR